MRIAIATDWFAPRRGGIEAQLTRLADALGERGHSVDVLTSMPGAADGAHFRVRPLDVGTLPGLGMSVSPLLSSRIRRVLRDGYDVVHAHVSVVSPVGYAAAATARGLELPTVVTFHSILRAKTFLLRAVNALARVSSGPVLWSGVSALVASQAERALGVPVAILPNGIDLGYWRAPQAGRNAGPVTLVFAGRFHRKKRPRELVRAFAAATRSSGPARLILVGDGPERAAIERDIRKLGTDGAVDARVELRGWLPRESLRALYAECDAFASAAARESFGIAVLEARAAGLPVIAMRAAGSTEFLVNDGNALLCGDDDELSRRLAAFIGNASLRVRLAAGPVALERYDWAAVLSEHEAAYRRAMTRAALAAKAVGA
jgi:glycosyltransferase involved in cell wall biosynthesis